MQMEKVGVVRRLIGGVVRVVDIDLLALLSAYAQCKALQGTVLKKSVD